MLKGKSTIQLFDKDTGRLQACYKDENMVTDAAVNLLNPKPHCYFASGDVIASLSKTTPLAINSLGGIILWQNALPETVGTIIPPSGSLELAHAGDAYSGSAVNRGTYNTNESGAIDGGYRHVWDFGTDRANGSFRALSLTSRKGGAIGWQSAENSVSVFDDIANFNILSYCSTFPRPFNACAGTSPYVCVGRYADNVYTFVLYSGNAIKIKNVACAREGGISLAVSVGSGAAQNTVVDEVSFTGISSAQRFCMTADGLLGFLYKTASKNYTITFVNPVTLEIDRTTTLQTAYDYDIYSDFIYDGGEYYLKRSGEAVIDVVGATGAVIRSIAVVSNTSLLMFMLGGGKFFSSGADLFYSSNGVDVVRLPPIVNVLSRVVYDCSPNYPYVLCAYSNDAVYGVLSAYLATVNNLDYVITKTDTQTMKITYELYND